MSIELQDSFVTRVDFSNQPQPPGTNIKLLHNYSYNVKYGKGDFCKGDLECHVKAEGLEDKIHLDFTICGVFRYSPDMPKEKVHTESYHLLYPAAAAFAATLTVNSGMRPIRLIKMDIKPSSIYRFDLGGIRGIKNNEDANGNDEKT